MISTWLRRANGSRATCILWQVVPSTGTSKSINSRSEHAVAPVHKAGKRPAYSGHETYQQQLLLLPSSSPTCSCRTCDGILLRAGWPGWWESGLLSRPASHKHTRTRHSTCHTSHLSVSSRFIHTTLTALTLERDNTVTTPHLEECNSNK